MSNRNYDIIIFGATGVIGRRIAHYIYQSSPMTKWAIMGRSHAELSSLMGELRQIGILGILPDILIADAQDFRTLRDTFVETRLLLNCVRPYRTLGKDIIEACLMARCDYMDLCSETYFIESNFLEFHEEAKKKNVFILHACGFDSAVSNLGVLFTLRNFQPDECNSIESFLSVTAPEGLGGDFKTYETLLNNQKDKANLSSLRHQIDERFHTPSVSYPGPRIAKKSDTTFDKRVGKFIVPNFGPDNAIMDQSMKTLALMTNCTSWPQYYSYIAMNNYYLATSTSFYSSLCSTLAGFSAGRTLLRSFPGVFTDGVISKSGPSEQQLNATTFQFQFIARGFAVMEEESAAAVTEEQKLLRKTAALAAGADVVTEHPDWVSNPQGGAGGNTRTIIPRNDLNETIVMENGPMMCGIWGGVNEGKNTYNNDLTGKVPIEMRVCVSGAEPYRLTTTLVCVALAQCLLEERQAQREAAYSAVATNSTSGVTTTAVVDRAASEEAQTNGMPLGGVYTPASAFYHSKCVFDRLKAAGIEYRVMTNEELAEESAKNLLVEANLAPQPPPSSSTAEGTVPSPETSRRKAAVASIVPMDDGHHHIESESQRRDRDAVMDLVRTSSILSGSEIPEPEPVVNAQNYNGSPTRRGVTPPPAAEARMA